MKKELEKQPARQSLRLRPMVGGYVIGVDGGGTKTEVALANLNGLQPTRHPPKGPLILKLAKTGPSNLRNVGIKKATQNIALAIKKVLPKKGKILSTFIALAAVEEEYKFKKEKIKREILKAKGISKISKGKIKIGSDQIVAFMSGTDKKDGVVLISGTGSVARGWRGKKGVKVSGWGWLADEGSGFWTGQKGFRVIFKELDGRGPKTKMTRLIFRKWKLKQKEDLLKKIYSKDSILQTSLISIIVDEASRMGDKIAISIMREAGEELARAAISVIEKLNFKNQKFPIVLVGKMFKSEIVLKTVKKEIRKIAPKVKFLRPKIEPVIGAVKLAVENIK